MVWWEWVQCEVCEARWEWVQCEVCGAWWDLSCACVEEESIAATRFVCGNC